MVALQSCLYCTICGPFHPTHIIAPELYLSSVGSYLLCCLFRCRTFLHITLYMWPAPPVKPAAMTSFSSHALSCVLFSMWNTHWAPQGYDSLWARQGKLFTKCNPIGPACGQTSGSSWVWPQKACLFGEVDSGSFHARMLIGTSKSWLMSTNQAN